MTPSQCSLCKELFFERPTLQAEVAHIARTISPGAAEAELNERLADEHAEH